MKEYDGAGVSYFLCVQGWTQMSNIGHTPNLLKTKELGGTCVQVSKISTLFRNEIDYYLVVYCISAHCNYTLCCGRGFRDNGQKLDTRTQNGVNPLFSIVYAVSSPNRGWTRDRYDTFGNSHSCTSSCSIAYLLHTFMQQTKHSN